MIEKTVLDYLGKALAVPAFMEEPQGLLSDYVVIEKTGSGRSNCISSATLAVQSYGSSLYEAALLNESVKLAMESIIELAQVSSVRLVSDYNFTDPETHRYRYQAVFDIVHY